MNRAMSAEESTISQDSDSPPKKKTGDIKKEAGRTKSLEPAVVQDNYECSICLSWLKEPVLTSCGHRFCKSCLEEWRKKNNTKCPLDDSVLSLEDIFPDNFTKREIENMRKSFPNVFDPPDPIFECSFATVACEFKSTDAQELEDHMRENYKEHIDLLLSSHLKMQFKSWEPAEKSPADGEGKEEQRDLFKSMYERIVVLEQLNREQALKIEKLSQFEMNRNGTLVWRIENFKRKVEMMESNAALRFYSSECFTDPNGYKFCTRINLSPKRKECLCLHVHLMKSDNDYHLSWPFIGRIKISMINKEQESSQVDILMSKPDILAFHRPQEEISVRGFGFMEYALVKDLFSGGFVNDDCLTIKIQMNIV